jgi:hypothetical protein
VLATKPDHSLAGRVGPGPGSGGGPGGGVGVGVGAGVGTGAGPEVGGGEGLPPLPPPPPQAVSAIVARITSRFDRILPSVSAATCLSGSGSVEG